MSVEDLSTARGLTAAEVAERVAAGQTNAAPPKSGRSIADIIRANVFTRINAILGVLFVIVAYTGSFINGLFGLMIIANSGIGIIQEIRAKLTLDKLAIVGQTRPTVRRDGVAAQIPADEVVVDDIIELGPGDQVVVDGVTVESQSLDVDESLLTGEADAVDKAPGDEILSGSFAVSGSGAYRATKVGADAYAAQLAAEAAKFTLVSSELRSGIDRILRVITYLLIPAGILTIVNQLFISKAALDDALLGMVAALVPMVPEGLVLLTSIAFAVGVIRLGRRQCLVNELPAIEGLARVNVVCTDKTGTLTENGMRLAEVRRLDSAPDELTAARIETALSALAAHDPRPNASIEALIEAFPDAPNWSVTSLLPFSSANKFSGMSFADETGVDAGNWLIGAPDVLLDPADPAAQLASDLGATGLRILLAAVTDVPVATEDGPGAPGNPVPVALIVLEQRVRPDAGETLDFFERQDVAVKVISGDNALSVGAVASSLGLGTPDDSVDARKLPEDRDELGQVVTDHVAFGRVRPDQKRAMVGALQARGDTVAMTGDGVNDVLALKDADIGVAMGSGSSAARSVAQIVLLDNKFATLPYVVAEGRRVIGNIERVANLFLTKTVYAVLLALMIGCVGVVAEVFDLTTISYPFRPIHVTISAWFTIGIPSFILSLAPNYERARTGFVRRVLTQAVPNGIIVGLATFICYYLVNPGGGGEVLGGSSHAVTAWTPEQTQASTAALITMIGGALWVLVMVARPYNWWKILLLIASALGYVVIFGWSWTQQLFQIDPTNMKITSVGLICLAVSIVALEVVNRIVVHFTGGRAADDGAEDFQEQLAPEPHTAA